MDPEGKIELGLGQTDNLNHDANELDSDIGRIAIGFAGSAERRWFFAALAGDIAYRKYDADDSAFDDNEVLGSVDGVFELHAIPDRFQWDFRGAYGQVRIDAFGATGPQNRQRTTSFSTGPQISLPLGQRTLFQLGGTVTEQTFEVTPDLDSRSKAALLGFERQIDRITSVSLLYEGREIDYDLNSQSHDIETLSFEYRRELASGEAFASIGRGRVEVNGIDSDPVTVGRLVWRRAVGARSSLEICLGREITNAGNAFANAGGAVACPGDLGSLAAVARTTNNRDQGIVSTTNPLVRNGGSLTFDLDGELGNFRATVSFARDEFEEDPTYDNDSTILEISAWRDFARQWRGELSARLSNQDFTVLVDENEDRVLRLSISRSLGSDMRLTLSFERFRRVSGLDPFDSNEYFLSFGRDFGR